MRKFLALVSTTVLATGAVQSAIAEETTLVEDPKSYFSVESITDSGDSAVTELDPSIGASRTYYDMNLKFAAANEYGDGEPSLFGAHVCLYDSTAAETEAEVDTLCGHNNNLNSFSSLNTIGQKKPQSALQFYVQPQNGSNAVIRIPADYASEHVVREATVGSTASHRTSTAYDFRGSTDVNHWEVKVNFALSHATNQSDSWKVRIIGNYKVDSSTWEIVKYYDDKTYTVNWFGAFGANGADGAAYERTSVNYGEIFDFSTKPAETGIATGSYYANGSSNISLSGTPFKLDGSSEGVGEVPLADSVPFTQSGETFTGTNEFGLECKSGLETPIFVQAASKTLLPGVDASNTQANVEDPLTADTHDCTLSYGTGAALGRYTNAITVGLGPVSE